MNRHDCRAAAARGRRTGYAHRFAAAMRAGAMTTKPGVHFANIEHDPDCGIYRGCGCGCDCVPDISISGPDDVTVIDEHGIGTKRARS
jgi:hypothetical protein